MVTMGCEAHDFKKAPYDLSFFTFPVHHFMVFFSYFITFIVWKTSFVLNG